MAISSDYVFSAPLTAELKDEIKRRSEAQLADMFGADADMRTMAEFVGVLIGNKKSMGQIANDLVDFIGDEHAQTFVTWLSAMLPTLEGGETAASEDAGGDDDADSLAPPSTDDAEQPPKRVISLKSVTSSEPPKKVISLTGGTVRSLNRDSKDMSDVLARRSQRFGIPDKPAATQQPNNKAGKDNNNNNSDARSNKRKAEPNDTQQKRPGSGSGRLAQLLGPPVNVDQAELDARDSLQSNKRKKTGRGDERDNRGARNEQENQRDSDGNGRRQNRRKQDKDDKGDSQPPLPPGSPRDRDRNGRSERGGRNDREGRDGRDGRDARGGRGDSRDFHNQGGFRGPPGYGGFAPPPYGHPMGYFPPPYGMPPYGMGFPHQGMPPGPYMQPPMPPGPPKQHYQPRGAPRPFMNKKWVNPNTVKPEGEAPTEGASTEEGSIGAAPGGAGAPAMNPTTQPYMPRNPYYNAQMRPRFQNKTWVRADPAKEEELSSSLPQTPPRDESEAAQ